MERFPTATLKCNDFNGVVINVNPYQIPNPTSGKL